MSLHLPEEWGEGIYCCHVATAPRGVGRRNLLLSCRYISLRSGEKESIVVMSLQLLEELGEGNYCCHVATAPKGVGRRKLLLSCRYIFNKFQTE